MKYLNPLKELRARNVVANPAKFPAESVELKAYNIAVKEKLEGEKLVTRIYEIIGGVAEANDKLTMPEAAKKAKKAAKEKAQSLTEKE